MGISIAHGRSAIDSSRGGGYVGFMKSRWLVLIGAAIATMVSYSPAVQQPYGVYLLPISQSFGWSRTMVSLGYSVVPLVAAPLVFCVGALIDRRGNRPVILAQAVGIPVLLLAFSVLQPVVWQFVLIAALGGLVASASTPASLSSILLQWFDRRLGLALGLSMAALGIGTAVLPPLIAHWIAIWGWRGAFRAEAALVGVIGILNALLLVWDNREFVQAKRNSRARAQIDGTTLRSALRQPVFHRVVASFFLMGLMFTGTSVHLVPILTDSGLSPQRAASLFGLFGVAQISGRLLCAAVIDQVRIIAFATAIYLLATVAYALLVFASPGREFLVPILLGLAAGVEVDVMGLIVRRWFGLRAAGRIYALCFAAFMLGSSGGPLFMASCFDRTGSYRIALALFTVGSLVVAWLFSGIGRYPQVAARPSEAEEARRIHLGRTPPGVCADSSSQ